MIDLLNTIIVDTFQKIAGYLPVFFSGLVILLFGIIVAGILKKIVFTFFKFIKIEVIFEKAKLIERKEVHLWLEVLTEVLRWTIIVLFLIPSFEIWGLTRASAVLNQFLFYLPNVLVAVIIAFFGLVISNLSAQFILSSAKTLGIEAAKTFSVVVKWLVLFLSVLVVLNQLGVAQDLIRIFFTGIIAMISLAGGLAFGLGGKDVAHDILQELRKKIK